MLVLLLHACAFRHADGVALIGQHTTVAALRVLPEFWLSDGCRVALQILQKQLKPAHWRRILEMAGKSAVHAERCEDVIYTRKHPACPEMSDNRISLDLAR